MDKVPVGFRWQELFAPGGRTLHRMTSVSVHCVTATPAGHRLADRLREAEALSVSTGVLSDEPPDTDALVVEHGPPEVEAVATIRRAIERPHRYPIVVFAPDGSERLAARAVRAGATDYWTAEDATDAPVAEWLRAAVERHRDDPTTTQTERERRLEALLAATDELHAADSVEHVCETVVRTASEILDLPQTGLWMRADDEAVLEPVAVSDRGRELADPPPFRPGESLAWAVHEAGETRWYDRVDEQADVHNESTPIRSEMLVPVGERGVLVSGSREAGAFDAADVRLLELLASSAAAALERTERERELERQNERLDRFVDVVGHDLRNPLAVAKANLEIARETGDDEKFEATAGALDRMERLIEDLRRLTREGESVTGTQRVSLRDVAEAAWSTADVGDARLHLGEDTTLSADPGRLRQLLENLLHNSAEHGAESQVSVTVSAFDGGFYVADDGPGIPPDRREAVFTPGVTTNEDGTGFGLAIVREIAEAHGWTVSVVESESGGSRFEIRT